MTALCHALIMRAQLLDAQRSRDGKLDECAIELELDCHKVLHPTLLTYDRHSPRHRVSSSQFCSDFHNVNHVLCPGPNSHFCSA